MWLDKIGLFLMMCVFEFVKKNYDSDTRYFLEFSMNIILNVSNFNDLYTWKFVKNYDTDSRHFLHFSFSIISLSFTLGLLSIYSVLWNVVFR